MTTSVQAANNNNSKNSEASTAAATTTAAAATINGIKAELAAPAAAVGLVAAGLQQQTSPSAPAAAVGAAAQLQVAAPLSSTVTPNSSTNRVMQADEDFNIRFVNLVRLHRCLYDKKVPEYRNRDNQEKAWVLISQETRENVIHCKERWRNLRACLSRYIKQQSGSEPQHKPYYLTEHMAFLLPFLKSARSTLDGNNSLATLYQLSQQEQHLHLASNPMHLLNPAATLHLQHNNELEQQKLELKHSLSENDDEETMDAFDPAITASLGLQRIPAASSGVVSCGEVARSPALSDTASANSMQNFIPDVQLAESGQDLIYQSHMHHAHPHHHHHHQHQHHHPHRRSDSLEFDDCSSTPHKRIKTECEATTSGQYYGMAGAENADMEFFRSILPDLSALTPQQKRKFKIGILELIDDVVDRYPTGGQDRSGSSTAGDMYNGLLNGSSNGLGASSTGDRHNRQQRRSTARDSWRK